MFSVILARNICIFFSSVATDAAVDTVTSASRQFILGRESILFFHFFVIIAQIFTLFRSLSFFTLSIARARSHFIHSHARYQSIICHFRVRVRCINAFLWHFCLFDGIHRISPATSNGNGNNS